MSLNVMFPSNVFSMDWLGEICSAHVSVTFSDRLNMCGIFSSQICMGSGACVRVWIDYWGLSFEVDGVPEDQGHVKGLCGNYNGDRNDDYMSPTGQVIPCATNVCRDFSNLWKVPREDDLFDHPPQEIEGSDEIELCECTGQRTATLRCGVDTNRGLAHFW